MYLNIHLCALYTYRICIHAVYLYSCLHTFDCEPFIIHTCVLGCNCKPNRMLVWIDLRVLSRVPRGLFCRSTASSHYLSIVTCSLRFCPFRLTHVSFPFVVFALPYFPSLLPARASSSLALSQTLVTILKNMNSRCKTTSNDPEITMLLQTAGVHVTPSSGPQIELGAPKYAWPPMEVAFQHFDDDKASVIILR